MAGIGKKWRKGKHERGQRPVCLFFPSRPRRFLFSVCRRRLLRARSLWRAHNTPQHKMGKVHGSLARAGKVRGQTPKVAKQDKKKLPKGRAIKRLKVRRIPVTISRLRFYPGLARNLPDRDADAARSPPRSPTVQPPFRERRRGSGQEALPQLQRHVSVRAGPRHRSANAP